MIQLFPSNSQLSLVMMLSPVLLNKIYLTKKIRKWAETVKQFLGEGQDLEVSQSSISCSKTEGLKLCSLETSVLKHHVKEGPVKSSKKLKYKPKDDDEKVTPVASSNLLRIATYFGMLLFTLSILSHNFH